MKINKQFTVGDLKEELEQVPDHAEVVRIDFMIVDHEAIENDTGREVYTMEYWKDLGNEEIQSDS